MTKRKKEAKSRMAYAPEKVLADWRTFMSALPHMNEEEVRKAYEVELGGVNRESYARRLYGKYNALRRKRELKEQEKAHGMRQESMG
jgi:hypothetical protein